ncbi:MAG: hypothetical protein LBO06_02120 [Bacteroidales bacterium]|nr:hypothetical protein [Bacteroidales bacterium]
MKKFSLFLSFTLLMLICCTDKQSCSYEYAVEYLSQLPEIRTKDSISFILYEDTINEQEKRYLLIKAGHNYDHRFETIGNYYLLCEDSSIYFLDVTIDSLLKIR